MPRETLSTRVTRLEDLAAALVEAQLKTEQQFRETDRRVADLVSGIGELIRRTDLRIAELSEKTDRRIAESNERTDRLIAESNERTDRRLAEVSERMTEFSENTDRRIGDLVAAIAELVRARNGKS
jgi:hypothetical protein